jgi:hypothetical protein
MGKTLESSCRPSCALGTQMGEAMLRDERGCTAQSRRAYHYADAHLATALRRLKRPRSRAGRMRSKGQTSGEGPLVLQYLLGGNPERGNQECCVTRKVMGARRACGCSRWRTGSGRPRRRSSGHVARHSVPPEPSAPGTHPRRGHAPAAGTNGRDNTQLDARRCCSRGIVCERVRAPAEIWRRPVIRERAAGVRLRLRLRHRSCSTTGSFEAQLHETRGHHFRDSRCASRSRERTMACFFTSRLRVSPIP